MTQQDFIRGRQHSRTCLCGCKWVVRRKGRVIERCDELELVIAEFHVPCPVGGKGRDVRIAYNGSAP